MYIPLLPLWPFTACYREYFTSPLCLNTFFVLCSRRRVQESFNLAFCILNLYTWEWRCIRRWFKNIEKIFLESCAMVFRRPFMVCVWLLSFLGVMMKMMMMMKEVRDYVYNKNNSLFEGGEGLCVQQKQLTLRKSNYVKQIGKFWQQVPWDAY